jgi:hypothetical protein
MTTSIEESLRAAIYKRSETESLHAISQGSQVAYASLYRFLNGERSLKLDNVSRLCDYLGLKLQPEDATPAKKPAKPPKRAPRKKKPT